MYKKEVWENGVLLRKTEYGGRFVYEGSKMTSQNYLSFVSMPEGRMAVDSLRKSLEPEFSIATLGIFRRKKTQIETCVSLLD